MPGSFGENRAGGGVAKNWGAISETAADFRFLERRAGGGRRIRHGVVWGVLGLRGLSSRVTRARARVRAGARDNDLI